MRAREEVEAWRLHRHAAAIGAVAMRSWPWLGRTSNRVRASASEVCRRSPYSSGGDGWTRGLADVDHLRHQILSKSKLVGTT